MSEELSLENLISRIKQSFGEFRDVCMGKNTKYDMINAGVGAFTVFFTQSPSFLSSQEDMKKANGACIWKVYLECTRYLLTIRYVRCWIRWLHLR